MRVQVNGLLPLITSTVIEYPNGDEVVATLKYERLEKHCSKCFRLDHELKDCLEAKHQNKARSAAQEANQQKQLSDFSVKETRDARDREPRGNFTFQSSASNNAETQERKTSKDTREISSHRAYKPQSKEWEERGSFRRSHQTRDRNFGIDDRYHRPSRDHSQRYLVNQGRSYYREIPRRANDSIEMGSLPLKHATETSARGVPLQICPTNLPREAVQEALGEVREAMLQYTKSADPTESEARKERMRQAEENGELEETAIQMVRASIAAETGKQRLEHAIYSPERVPVTQRLGPSPTPQNSRHQTGRNKQLSNSLDRTPANLRLGPAGSAHVEAMEVSPITNERVPASLRLGPSTEPGNHKEPLGVPSGEKRKPGRPLGRRKVQGSPKPGAGTGSKKRKMALVNPVNDGELIQKITADLDAAYLAEEEYWRQRSRLLWLRLGDRNTGYFHAVTRKRRRANSLSVIEDSTGTMVYKEGEIAKRNKEADTLAKQCLVEEEAFMAGT
ncbi:hypothetical protein Bca52824_048812 [Brassica carinata]|uniref:Zinc knuckle CX2CX4HX4C domain-containing protein n=1 Tax=Brassica carinata TaxID=52824 RepID=A0A8X7RHA7_BRACI|nr:hypothetical protein Bca52824_048812 [Brassica carinata]